MKIQVASDLHVRSLDNLLSDYIVFTNADVLVLAGDIAPLSSGIVNGILCDAAEHYSKVIFVAGNHEFYGGDLKDIYNLKWAFRYNDHVHVLTNESCTIDGVKFFGGTMWADVALNEYVSVSVQLNDFRLINDFYVNTSCKQHKEFISKFDNEADVVITHFGPSKRSIHQMYMNSDINSYFCNSFLDSVTVNAKVWIHGHVHSSWDYELNGTRVICNPKGYGNENRYYDRSLIYVLD